VEIRAVLDRGGVIGGSSAGATIQGSYLARGDTRTNTIMMGDHEVGFGYLKNTAIDQHVLRRNRHFDLIEIIEARPELLGIGIDENTAIVVQGDQFEVIGASMVLIYDNQKTVGEDGRFYFLAPGDRFNLATREATRPGRSFNPVEGPEARPWPGRGR
jgi:cyanophycinase